MALFVRIKVKSPESCRDKIKVVDLGLDSHVNDGVDTSIRA